MAIPITLGYGQVMVYGWGVPPNAGIIPTNTNIKFGSVYQIWEGGAAFIYGSQDIMWKDGDEYFKFRYNGNPYTVLPARLVTREQVEV